MLRAFIRCNDSLGSTRTDHEPPEVHPIDERCYFHESTSGAWQFKLLSIAVNGAPVIRKKCRARRYFVSPGFGDRRSKRLGEALKVVRCRPRLDLHGAINHGCHTSLKRLAFDEFEIRIHDPARSRLVVVPRSVAGEGTYVGKGRMLDQLTDPLQVKQPARLAKYRRCVHEQCSTIKRTRGLVEDLLLIVIDVEPEERSASAQRS